MEDVGGSKTLFALGRVITTVGYDGCNLIVEVVLCLIGAKGIMSMASSRQNRKANTYGYNGVNGAGIGDVSLYLDFVSGA